MPHFEDFQIVWDGRPAVAHAHIDAKGEVQVMWLDVGNGPETHVSRSPRTEGDDVIAFSAWTEKRRALLYQEVRNAL